MSTPIRPCFVVPVYNHSRLARRTLDTLAGRGMRVFVVDDGSAEDEAAELSKIAADIPAIQLIRLPLNQGKGGAVMAGLRAAHAAGFTHALQVDADGQHDLRVISEFLALGQSNPCAVICGQPVYDASIPRVRRLARYLTHFWVWVETLSLEIRDSMCGFRLYPLRETVEVLDEAELPRRMSFDIEVLVRLHWRKVPFEWIPVSVTYPPDGRSHFRPLVDNAQISLTHARLVLAMPWRILCGSRARQSEHWSRRSERGSGLGLRITAWLHRHVGRWLAAPIVWMVATYFFLTGPAARRASREYLARLHAHTGGGSPRPSLWATYRHFLAFGSAAHDKMAGWVDEGLLGRFDFPGFEVLRAARESGRGALIIGAHLGNLDLMRAVARRYGLVGFHAIVYHAHSAKFTGMVRSVAPESEHGLVHVPDFGPVTAMRLRELIDRGECVVIVGDRTPPSENGQTVTVDFLGAPAEFPRGPYVLAAALECPVYLLFCLRDGDIHRVEVVHMADRVSLPRSSRFQELARLARVYAAHLEQRCARHPLQWFNFYDFWKPTRTTPSHDT